MSLVEGVHHVTFLTEDLDRLVAFYERVFEANKTLDMTEEGVRHVFIGRSGRQQFSIRSRSSMGRPCHPPQARCSNAAG